MFDERIAFDMMKKNKRTKHNNIGYRRLTLAVCGNLVTSKVFDFELGIAFLNTVGMIGKSCSMPTLSRFLNLS